MFSQADGQLVGWRFERLSLPAQDNARKLVAALAAIVVVVGANVFAARYVAAEHYIYYWDWAAYWSGYQQLGELARHHPFAALKAVSSSVRLDDYNLLQVAPLVPFELVGGPGRTSFIIAITNAGVIPSAALMALIVTRLEDRPSWGLFIACVAMLLTLHPLWAAALRGFPDVIGVVIAAAILLTYFGEPIEGARIARLVRLGALLCVIILVRRWYLFWVVAFLPAALLAAMLSPSGLVPTRRLITILVKLAIAGSVCLLFLLLLAAPTVIRVLTTDYQVAFQAYRSAGNPIQQAVNQFGLLLIGAAGVGLVCLIVDARSRPLGILVAVQALLSMFLFAHVQRLFGVQHFYIVVPALGIGVAGAVRAGWQLAAPPTRFAALGAIAAVTLASSSAVLSAGRSGLGPFLPSATYAPMQRSDIPEIDRLLARLVALNPRKVYVIASSEVLNWSTLKMRCRDKHPGLCEHLAQSADIDTRDGFPATIAESDYAILATPVQYHVDPTDQQVIGLLARDFTMRQGVGHAFAPLPGVYTLDRGVHVQIYRRTNDVADADLRGLADELLQAYPGMRILDYRPSGG